MQLCIGSSAATANRIHSRAKITLTTRPPLPVYDFAALLLYRTGVCSRHHLFFSFSFLFCWVSLVRDRSVYMLLLVAAPCSPHEFSSTCTYKESRPACFSLAWPLACIACKGRPCESWAARSPIASYEQSRNARITRHVKLKQQHQRLVVVLPPALRHPAYNTTPLLPARHCQGAVP